MSCWCKSHLGNCVAAHDEAANARVFLHRSSKWVLSLLGERVDLMEHQDFHFLFALHRPAFRHVLDDFLDNIPAYDRPVCQGHLHGVERTICFWTRAYPRSRLRQWFCTSWIYRSGHPEIHLFQFYIQLYNLIRSNYPNNPEFNFENKFTGLNAQISTQWSSGEKTNNNGSACSLWLSLTLLTRRNRNHTETMLDIARRVNIHGQIGKGVHESTRHFGKCPWHTWKHDCNGDEGQWFRFQIVLKFLGYFDSTSMCFRIRINNCRDDLNKSARTKTLMRGSPLLLARTQPYPRGYGNTGMANGGVNKSTKLNQVYWILKT